MGRSLEFSKGHIPPTLDPRRINPETSGGNFGKIVDPSDKAAVTRGQSITGRIKREQIELLVKQGYKRSTVVKWTAYRASQVIEKGWRARPRAIQAISINNIPLVACPHCEETVETNRLIWHIRKSCPGVRNLDTEQIIQMVTSTISTPTNDNNPLVICPYCRDKVGKKNLMTHCLNRCRIARRDFGWMKGVTTGEK